MRILWNSSQSYINKGYLINGQLLKRRYCWCPTLCSDLTNANSAGHAWVTVVVVSPYKDVLFAKRTEEHRAQVPSGVKHRHVEVIAIFAEVSFLFCFSLTRLVYLCTFVYVSQFLPLVQDSNVICSLHMILSSVEGTTVGFGFRCANSWV